MGEVAARENGNDQQELQNGMNEAAFSNCNVEDYINIDKDVQTEPDTMDINALVQNFKEVKKKERRKRKMTLCWKKKRAE